MRQRLRAHLGSAIAQMEVANRIDIVPEKKAHLERAIIHLETALAERAGSHLLRQQLAICCELLREIDRGASDCRGGRVEVIICGE